MTRTGIARRALTVAGTIVATNAALQAARLLFFEAGFRSAAGYLGLLASIGAAVTLIAGRLAPVRDLGWRIAAPLTIVVVDHFLAGAIFSSELRQLWPPLDVPPVIPALSVRPVELILLLLAIGAPSLLDVERGRRHWRRFIDAEDRRSLPFDARLAPYIIVLAVLAWVAVGWWYASASAGSAPSPDAAFVLPFRRMFAAATLSALILFFGPKPLRWRLGLAVALPLVDWWTFLLASYSVFRPLIGYIYMLFAINVIGVMLAFALYWATGPVGGLPNERRATLYRYLFLRAARDRSVIRQAVYWAVASVGLTILVATLIVWFSWSEMGQSPVAELGILIAILIPFAAGPAAFGTVQLAATRESQPYVEAKPCLRCGTPCTEVDFDDRGWSACPECGRPVHAGDWNTPPILGRERARRIWNRRIGWKLTLGFLMVPIGGALLVVMQLNLDATMAAAFAILPLTLLFVWRTWRVEVARVFDRQHLECRECEYDLRATPVDHGLGVCPECGTTFARFEDDGDVHRAARRAASSGFSRTDSQG